jgi:hypothetical protein
MKPLFRASSILLLIISILLPNPRIALASEEEGGHGLEAEINGYHVTLSSQNEWAKGENTIIVTLTDETGRPISDADVDILITPKSDGHAEPEADAHGAESAHDSMPEMDVEEAEELEAHEDTTIRLTMTESHEHGTYVAETHLGSSGAHEITIFFHVNGEMLQTDFSVDIARTTSRTVVLWSFLFVNVGLVTCAGILRRQPVSVKGKLRYSG